MARSPPMGPCSMPVRASGTTRSPAAAATHTRPSSRRWISSTPSTPRPGAPISTSSSAASPRAPARRDEHPVAVPDHHDPVGDLDARSRHVVDQSRRPRRRRTGVQTAQEVVGWVVTEPRHHGDVLAAHVAVVHGRHRRPDPVGLRAERTAVIEVGAHPRHQDDGHRRVGRSEALHQAAVARRVDPEQCRVTSASDAARCSSAWPSSSTARRAPGPRPRSSTTRPARHGTRTTAPTPARRPTASPACGILRHRGSRAAPRAALRCERASTSSWWGSAPSRTDGTVRARRPVVGGGADRYRPAPCQ